MNDLLIPKIGSIQPRSEGLEKTSSKGGDGSAFESALRGELSQTKPSSPSAAQSSSPLKFSAHALNRIKDRSISMNEELKGKLERAVDTAAQKGSKESLILSDNAAFIVSVRNKTVITVLDRNQMNGNVFTNIDSTVVI